MNDLTNYQKRLLARMKKDSDATLVHEYDSFRAKLFIRFSGNDVRRVENSTYSALQDHLCMVRVSHKRTRKGYEGFYVFKHPDHVKDIVHTKGAGMMSADVHEQYAEESRRQA